MLELLVTGAAAGSVLAIVAIVRVVAGMIGIVFNAVTGGGGGDMGGR